MTATYDAIIIGTGQAGAFLVGRLATAGMKVAIIERKLFGFHALTYAFLDFVKV